MTIIHAVAVAARFQPDPPFREAWELLPFAVLVSNPNGQVVLANAAAQKLFGYSHEELIGVALEGLIPAAGGIGERYVRRRDGTEFPAEVTANLLSPDAASDTLTVVVDRTDHHELLRNRQELAHLTRVSTLGQLAGSLAHELNQPLTAILSNAQAAQRFMAMEPINLVEVREILEDLVKDNHRASEVLRRIRVLVKKEELEAAALSLESVVRDVALLVHSDAVVRGIRMHLNVSSELPSVYGDRVRLQQVVLNLLLNAFEALGSHSMYDRVVTIEATLDSSKMIRVAVRDRGPGLAGDKLDKLFMPYFTSKRDGLGLGLSISRSIVEMHGGHIWAENNEDQGAAFYFTLPTGAAAERTHLRQPP